MDIDEIRLRNLDQLIREAGSKKMLARNAGTSSNYLSQIHANKRRSGSDLSKVRRLGPELCRKLELARGKPLGWMDQIHTGNTTPDEMPTVRRVPLLDWSECLRVKTMTARELLEKETSLYMTYTNNPTRFYAMKVKDDSMWNPLPDGTSFPRGCTVIIDPDLTPEPFDFVIVRIAGREEATLRQFVHDGVNPYFKSLNPTYQGTHLHDYASGTVEGVVVQIKVEVKKIS